MNLYAPSTAEWKSAGAKLVMDTTFPEGESATLTLTLDAPRELTLALRRPYWAGEGFGVRVNGQPVTDLPGAGSYVELKRSWKSGDSVSLVLPKALRLEPLPDNPRRVAILWGPLVLAGDLGNDEEGRAKRPRGKPGAAKPAVPVFLAADRPVAEWLKPVVGKPGTFRTDGVGRDRDVEFSPFYRLHRRTYGIYWDLFTPEEWERKGEAHTAAEARRHALEAATVDYAQPGEMQSETDHQYQGEGPVVARVLDRAARRGGQWFSLKLAVDPERPLVLIVTYCSEERQRRSFTILADGQRLGERTVERLTPDQEPTFSDVEYRLPALLTKGKQKLSVRFQAAEGSARSGPSAASA